MSQLTVGMTAPDFTLPLAGGGEFNLATALADAEKGVVVYFYPRAMTPGCTKQACDFRDSENSLRSAGYTVVGVSSDSLEALEKFVAKEALNFPLVSDVSKEMMRAWGAYGEKKNYGRLLQGVIRSTIVLDKTGVVQLALYNVKATGHVARLRYLLGIDG